MEAGIEAQVNAELNTARSLLQEEYDDKLKERERKLREEQAEEKRLAIVEAVNAESARQKTDLEFVKKGLQILENEKQELKGELSAREAEIHQQSQYIAVKERLLDDTRTKLVLENARTLEEEKKRVEEETRKRIEDENTLKLSQDVIAMESLRREINDLKRKAEQTSQQLIGEGQEVALEEALRMAFPTDLIEPVQKGMKGADCIQKVRTNGDVLGIIVWESKRTKQWLNEWVGKLKDDQRTLNAELAILVTQTLPSGFATKAGIHEGIWITDFPTAISVAMALRSGLIYAASMKALSSGSDEKSQAIFEYVTSPEFRGNMQAIIETFVAFEADLAAEKRAMEKQWKKRETTIKRALTASHRIYGSLQATLGEKALPDIKEEAPKQIEA
jgi:hypothetical protein